MRWRYVVLFGVVLGLALSYFTDGHHVACDVDTWSIIEPLLSQ